MTTRSGGATPRLPAAMTPLEAAKAYVRQGCSVIPVPDRSKNPGLPEWQKLRLTESDLPQHFNGRRQNLGLLLGEASGGLVDVDCDTSQAVALAPLILPETHARFG